MFWHQKMCILPHSQCNIVNKLFITPFGLNAKKLSQSDFGEKWQNKTTAQQQHIQVN